MHVLLDTPHETTRGKNTNLFLAWDYGIDWLIPLIAREDDGTFAPYLSDFVISNPEIHLRVHAFANAVKDGMVNNADNPEKLPPISDLRKACLEMYPMFRSDHYMGKYILEVISIIFEKLDLGREMNLDLESLRKQVMQRPKPDFIPEGFLK